MEYVGDVLGMWETEQRRVVAAAKREFPELRVLSHHEYAVTHSISFSLG